MANIYYINLNGGGGATFKYAWYAEGAKYDAIAAALGITAAGANETGLVFGANNPKPPVVRLNLEDGGGLAAGSQTVFVDPANYGAVLGGSLNGQTTNGKTIRSASAIRG